MSEERSVLHVLPHPGGGGETYVDLLSEMDGYRFDRVYLATSPSPRGAWRSLAAGVARAPRAAWSHDIVHAHGEVASALMLPALAARPSVVTTHGLHFLRRASGVGVVLARAALRAVTAATTITICTSEVERLELHAVMGSERHRQLRVIHNGVKVGKPAQPLDKAAARAALGLRGDDLVAAWMGGLDTHKDPATPAQAAVAARAAGLRIVLLLAGDGPLRSEMDELARRSGDSVRVLGFRSDGASILAAADFFVVSSVREGLSFSLLEAMSAGLAVVASRTPGNVEAVGEAGIIVSAGDVGALSSAYARLASDDGARIRLGATARARIAARFTLETMIRETQAAYADAWNLKRGRRKSASSAAP